MCLSNEVTLDRQPQKVVKGWKWLVRDGTKLRAPYYVNCMFRVGAWKRSNSGPGFHFFPTRKQARIFRAGSAMVQLNANSRLVRIEASDVRTKGTQYLAEAYTAKYIRVLGRKQS